MSDPHPRPEPALPQEQWPEIDDPDSGWNDHEDHPDEGSDYWGG
jgi:hypothetical protein